MTTPREIRPNGRVFVVRATVRAAVFTLPLVFAAAAFAPLMEFGSGLGFALGLAAWLALVVFTFIQRRVIFAKTRYLIYPDRIVLESGGLLSERSVDLQFTNVTRSGLTLPFIEHRLYETGHITIEAAGSAAAEIVLESVDEPRAVFDSLTESLRSNGFSLARGRKVQQEKPGFVGSLYELGAPIFTTSFVLLFLIPDLLDGVLTVAEVTDVGELLDLLSSGELVDQATHLSIGSIVAGLLLVAGSMAGGVAFLALRWMDILKRTYTLYDDVIDYTDGFLTKRHSFIPVENLTDVEIDQQLAQRVLSISTIKVSCQGAGVDIRLGAVPNGQQFKANLERLIDESGPVRPVRQTVDRAADPAPATTTTSATTSADAGPAEPAVKLPRVEGKYDWRRGVVGPVVALVAGAFSLLLPFLLGVALVPEIGAAEAGGVVGIVLLIAAVSFVSRAVKVFFQAYALDYAVDDRKVTHTYDLLARKQIEFTIDKISAVEIHRSPVDRWMKTAKVVFTSIGSTEKITFENLANAEAVIDAVLARMRLDATAVRGKHQPRFSVGGQVRAMDGWSVLLVLCILASLPVLVFVPLAGIGAAVVCVVGLVARSIYLKLFYDRASLSTGENWLRFRSGILMRRQIYIPARQVRGLDARCNLGEGRGALTVRSGGGATGQLGFLDEVWQLQQSFDEWLHQQETGALLDTDVVTTRRPAVFNAVTRLTAVLVLTVFGAPFLVFAIPWTIVATRRVQYELQGGRVVRLSGVFRKRRDTILLQRIDHLTTARGPLNRMNDTGSIGVVTLGSSGTDMLVRDVADHQGFYETLESMTKRSLTSGGSS